MHDPDLQPTLSGEHVVIFMAGERNLRSQRAMEKIGGVRRPDLLDRAYRDVVVRHVVFEIRRGS